MDNDVAAKPKRLGPLTYFQLDSFPAIHGFFSRQGGKSAPPYHSFNTAFKTDDPASDSNRKLLFELTDIENRNIVILSPNHGQEVVFIDDPTEFENDRIRVLKGVDAVFSNIPDTYFLVSAADCLILLLTDASLSFVGIVHLGWRNLIQNFGVDCIHRLAAHYHITIESVIVGIGPCIYPCCYIFKDPAQKDELFWEPFLYEVDGHRYAIDLVSALKTQFEKMGFDDAHLHELNLCTGCNNHLFFSCYKEGYVSGRFPTLVGLSPMTRWSEE